MLPVFLLRARFSDAADIRALLRGMLTTIGFPHVRTIKTAASTGLMARPMIYFAGFHFAGGRAGDAFIRCKVRGARFKH